MSFTPAFLQHEILGNTAFDWLVAALSFLGCIAVLGLAKLVVLRRLRVWAEKTTTTIDDFIIASVERIAVPLAYFGAFYVSLTSLALPPVVRRVMGIAVTFALTVAVIRFAIEVVNYALLVHSAKKQSDPGHEQLVRGMMPFVKVFLWALGVVFLLDNLGYKVSTVLAGLGIGGVAVALAAQAVLGDLFSYFAIMFDRPFSIGDFIVVGEHAGAVEHIGIKTTRLRSIDGEQLVFSNTDLTGSRIHNYKRMDERRVVLRLGAAYGTDDAKLKRIPAVLKDLVGRIKDARFDRAHLAALGASSIDYELVYFVLSGDYARHMDVQQEVLLGVKQEFDKLGVEIPFPTQTLHVASLPAAPGK